jgi:hypothetical protein
MANPVQTNTPSDSYQVATTDPSSNEVDIWTTGLTITVTLPGVVTVKTFSPRQSSALLTVYPEVAFDLYFRI